MFALLMYLGGPALVVVAGLVVFTMLVANDKDKK